VSTLNAAVRSTSVPAYRVRLVDYSLSDRKLESLIPMWLGSPIGASGHERTRCKMSSDDDGLNNKLAPASMLASMQLRGAELSCR
jgi:hypothetical protein